MDNKLQVITIPQGSSFAQRCKHFRSMAEHDTCEKGIKYLEVRVDQPFRYRYEGDKTVYSRGKAMPCYKDWDPHGVCDCSFQQFPTDDEVREHQAWINERINRIGTARQAIVEHTKGKRGVSGSIDCPVCNQGKLQFSVSGYNGHIHAGCTTEKCVRWME
jgi:hypothetical protein